MTIYNNISKIYFNGCANQSVKDTIVNVNFNNVQFTSSAKFNHCTNLKSISNINKDTTNMCYMFAECNNLTSIPDNFPPNVVNLATVYANCNITSIPSIPNSVTDIAQAFSHCRNLINAPAELPSSIVNYTRAFYTDPKLTTAPNINAQNTNSLSGIFYNDHDITSANIIVGKNVTTLAQLFTACYNLQSLNLTYTDFTNTHIINISGTFNGCKKLASFPEFPNTIINMSYSFYNCTNLTAINCPTTAVNMHGAFIQCINLATLNIPNSVTTLTETFCDCSTIDNLTIPSSVVGSLEKSFCNCTNLVNIVGNISANVDNLAQTFYGCNKITKPIYIESDTVENATDFFGNTTANKYVYIPLYTKQSQTQLLYCWRIIDTNEKLYFKVDSYKCYNHIDKAYNVEGKLLTKYKFIYTYDDNSIQYNDPEIDGELITVEDDVKHYIEYLPSDNIELIIPAGSNTITYESFLDAGYSTTTRQHGVLLREIGVDYYSVTINSNVQDATIQITYAGNIYDTNTIVVPEGANIQYSVSASGYITQADAILNIQDDIILNITLLPETVTYTINPTPNDATVILTAAGYVQSGNSINVPINTIVNWSVSKEHYITQSGSKNITQNTIDNITLNIATKKLNVEDYNYTLTNTYEVTLTEYIGNNIDVVLPELEDQ